MSLVRLINSIKQCLDDVFISGGQDTVGVTEAVEHEDCAASLEEAATRYQSLLQHAQEAGLATGLVTTDSLTGASPAGGGAEAGLVPAHTDLLCPGYAHSASRDWENNQGTPPRCEDLAAQLVRRQPGSSLRVILGGGRQHFNNSAGAEDGRTDGADLEAEWLEARRAEVSAS